MLLSHLVKRPEELPYELCNNFVLFFISVMGRVVETILFVHPLLPCVGGYSVLLSVKASVTGIGNLRCR